MTDETPIGAKPVSPELSGAIDDMIAIIRDPAADDDEVFMAVNTIGDAHPYMTTQQWREFFRELCRRLPGGKR